MPEPERKALEPGQLFAGRYRIVQRIARGAVGIVYEVVDTNTDRARALKVLSPALVTSDELRRRFAREATIAGRIESSHLVDVTDAGVAEESSVPYMVMDLLTGSDLAALLAERGPLDAATVVGYLAQVAELLDQAHAAGIVHRDLKPANIFLVESDGGAPHIKVLDFGIAKLLQSSGAEETATILGSPHFMAPEQIRFKHERVGARADVYALGHLAYCMLAGEPYWLPEDEAADSLMHLLMEIAFGAKQAASERARERCGIELPSGFDAWFARSTAVKARDRFAAASEAVRALARAADVALPRTTSSGTTLGSSAAPRRRTRWRGALAAAVLAAAALVATLARWQPPPARASALDLGRLGAESAPPLAAGSSLPAASSSPPPPPAPPSSAPASPAAKPSPRPPSPPAPPASAPPESSATASWLPPVVER
jgi:serine/threonine-protein kinase